MNEGRTLHNQTQKSYSPTVQRLLYTLILFWIIAGTLLPLVAFFRTGSTMTLLSLAFLILPTYILFHDKKLFHGPSQKRFLLQAGASVFQATWPPAASRLVSYAERTCARLYLLPVFLMLLMVLGIGVGTLRLAVFGWNPHTTSTTGSSTVILPHPDLSPITHPAATSTLTSNLYPRLAASYSGTIVDLQANISSQMTLAQMQQNAGHISGSFSGMRTNATYSGFLDTSKHIYFTVATGGKRAPLYFTGSIRADGTLSGEFCEVDQNDQCMSGGIFGLWNVAPAVPVKLNPRP